MLFLLDETVEIMVLGLFLRPPCATDYGDGEHVCKAHSLIEGHS